MSHINNNIQNNRSAGAGLDDRYGNKMDGLNITDLNFEAWRTWSIRPPIELREGRHYMCSFNDGCYEGVLYCVGDECLVLGHDHSLPKGDYTILYEVVKKK